jgi:HPt (histidine-containing phosphotransfer) domain-containing protein
MNAGDLLGGGSDSESNVIDEEHLGRMTLGDRGLERDLLQLFVRQSAMIVDRISGQDCAAMADAAHTIIGSARSIGVWRVAKAAEQLERVVGEGNEKALQEAVAALKSASLEANAAIEARLADASRDISNCA